MIVGIENEIFTKLDTELPDALVIGNYDESADTFPRVVFHELINTAGQDTRDSDGEKYNQQSFNVEIYTVGNRKKSDANNIRLKVDEILSGFYNLERDFSESLPNFMDRNIYRYVMRYSCMVDKNKVIYRR